MKPTTKFRLLRVDGLPKGTPFITDSYGHYYIFQQWWAIERNGQITPDGEWVNVPMEIE